MSEHTGVYLRGGIWWYRVGRSIRRSSRSADVSDALRMRAHAVLSHRHRLTQDEWSHFVGLQRADGNSWLRRTHSHMRRKTRLRGWQHCISLEEFTLLVLMSNGMCAITGLAFHRDTAARRHPFSISVDRIDSSHGYRHGNIRCVLLAVNLAMSHWGDESFRTIARALVGRELIEKGATGLHTTFEGTAVAASKVPRETDG